MEILLAHAKETLALHPDSSSGHGKLGELQMRHGDFTDASAELAKAVRLAPRDPVWTLELACLYLFIGDHGGYRASCRRLLDSQVNLSDPIRAADAAQICLISAPAASDLPRITELAGRVAGTTPERIFDEGLIELRRGNSAAAQPLFQRMLSTDPQVSDKVAANLYLALCLAQEGDDSRSLIALEAAEADFAQLPKISDGDLTADFINVLICHIARREARAALGLPVQPATQPAR